MFVFFRRKSWLGKREGVEQSGALWLGAEESVRGDTKPAEIPPKWENSVPESCERAAGRLRLAGSTAT